MNSCEHRHKGNKFEWPYAQATTRRYVCFLSTHLLMIVVSCFWEGVWTINYRVEQREGKMML